MPEAVGGPGLLVTVVRDGFVESRHLGHVAVADVGGAVLAGLGEPDALVYGRSATKPFQTVATLELLAEAGRDLPGEGVAIASASHRATTDQQIEAAHLLACAGLDESALRCPPAQPTDSAALMEDPAPSALAHNCSGKHAGFLLAHTVGGGEPTSYLDPETALQRRVRAVLERYAGAVTEGPGIDGCGAPAWRLPLSGIATAFARLAAGGSYGTDADGNGDGAVAADPLARVRDAMARWPHLVGGAGTADTEMMRAQDGLVAKRGAEGVLAAGWSGPDGPRGVAIKVADGASRATGPVAATILAGLGACVPDDVRWPAVLGGGRPHGRLSASSEVEALSVPA